MSAGGIILVALVIAVGLVGIVVPVLPGTLLVFGAIAVWAVVEGRENNLTAWVTLGAVSVLLGAALVVKYLWPVRRMRAADVRTPVLLVGAVFGIVGFFVIPVLGLVLGFVLGVYLAELADRRDQRLAWTSTKEAVKGVALSVGVELAGAVLATAVWVIGVYQTT
ncbi:DUF456 domain-containing protein [Mycolicibacterium elephantis]|uniref:DUF456 domain-containing protein n=1 Tax=Mycolicibacterium elephantis TaxID=81858 RepID=UPI0007EBA423|nr:DUF456 domain-containing protein [Mycolicibacterium elephantis]OBB16420.1 hypothetical protein A5762_03770 [Mycolicibacterium elephantis]OBE95380.1 hypothetical protein A5776_02210 [Mycolicibacterium elephantis]